MRCKALIFVSFFLLLNCLSVFAHIPEPDNIIYGEIYNKSGQKIIFTEKLRVSLEINNQELASYTLGDKPSAGDNYILRVPLDSLEPLLSGNSHTGDIATIKVDGNQVLKIDDIIGTTVIIGTRGTILRKKLTMGGSACIPGVEICDGKDNNCDGQTDEGFNVGMACSVGQGECRRTGTMVCKTDGSGTQCNAVPGTPSNEICDGKDNNCDGQTDEGFNVGVSCSAGQGECRRTGTMVCKTDGSGTQCNAIPGTPSNEICDGYDNDCNGDTPSNETDGDTDWFRPCSGDCDDANPAIYPGASERADNKDNDCDGKIDESNIIIIRQDNNFKQWLSIHNAPTAATPDIGSALASYATPIGNAKTTSVWAVFSVVAGDFDNDGIYEIAVLFQNNTAPYGQYLNIYEAPQGVGNPLPAPIAGFKFIGAPGTFNNVTGAVAGDFIPGHPGDEIGLLKENTATGGQRIVFYAPPTQLNETLPLEANALATYKWIGNRNGLMIISASSGDYNNDGAIEIGFGLQNQNPISPWKGTQLLQVYTSPSSGYSGALPPGSLIASYGYIGMQNTVSSILGTCGGNFSQTNAGNELGLMRKNAQGTGSLRIIRPPQALNAALPAPLAADYDIGTEVTIVSGIR